ncbi:hypothetical protein VdG1_03487 [Verticillium dahliae VDG1]|nr:hypothetical protein VdG1_03487 [Verticillium dahliae VDG1]
MSSSRERRIIKELADMEADKDNSGVFAQPVSEASLLHLKGTLPGPPDSPYAGGRFVVDIVIPDMYPFKSPIMKFDTKIWHPNISSQTGAICLDTLGTGWSPVQTIKTALLSLRMLLEFPNPKDPQDAELDTSRYTAEAGADKAALDETRYDGYNRNLVERFVGMGFQVDAVVDAFKYVGIDRNDGRDYELEEAYMGDITARLLGEQ